MQAASGEHPETKPSDLLQLKALFRKTAILQVRQRKTMVCQILMPVLLLVVIWAIQYYVVDPALAPGNNYEFADAKLKCDQCMNGYTDYSDNTVPAKGGSRPLKNTDCCMQRSCFCPVDSTCNFCKVSVTP